MRDFDKFDIAALTKLAAQMRCELVRLSHCYQTMHLAGSLSCVDIVTALYWNVMRIDPKNPEDPDRDRFILSKGHAATTLYTALAMKSFFPRELLDTLGQDGSRLAEHPGVGCVPGMELATGSLGHGLNVAIGMALASKLRNQQNNIFVLLSDGECNEGSVWEAALFAPVHKLGNICAVVDFNRWQATGRSQEVMALDPLKEKWECFGWDAYEVDGHDFALLIKALNAAVENKSAPSVIIAHTIKGKGVSFMEDDNNWHYRIPTKEELEQARTELGMAAE